MKITAAALARMINATIEGDPNVVITAPARIEEAGPGCITFLANPAYEEHLYASKAAAVLVTKEFKPRQAIDPTMLRVDDVYATVQELLKVYQEDEASKTRRAVSGNACVEETAQLGQNVRVGKFSVVEEGAVIGAGTVILDQVYVGPDVKIGKGCTLYPGVRILRGCEIGDNCVIHSNAVIGGDGFGFRPDDNGHYQKVNHVGNVKIEDDVEIGAGTTIDRAVMGSTLIRQGVKLDNLVMVGHNVEIGAHTVIAAQAGIAGSTRIGAHCRIGGQVGFAGHLTIADNTQFQAQAGVATSVKEPGQAFGGSPAFEYRKFFRSAAVYNRLPDLRHELMDLRRRVDRLVGSQES